MSAADRERLSHFFSDLRVSNNQQRRGSDSGSGIRTFHLGSQSNLAHSQQTVGGAIFGRDASGKNCQLHFFPPGVSSERRGSTGNILWRKGSAPNPHAHLHRNDLLARRGSTPGDLLLFPSHRKDSRKFSQDSIDLNEPVGLGANAGKLWTNSQGIIFEEENEKAGSGKKQKFVKVTSLEDTQAIRCAEFHPRGHLYAVGSNSKTLRICGYPSLSLVSENQVPHSPNILYKRNKHHRGSIYCLGWSPDGSLLATGSNDKTIKLLRFDDINRQQQYSHSQEVELTMHDGTVRDICFIEDLSNKSSLIVSGGAGDCKVYVTDCVTATPFQSLSGHSAPILSLYNWGGVMFCSGSQDKTVRIWDLRSRGCVNVISPLTCPSSGTTKSPVGSVCVDPTGRLLISGHEDSAIVLYDIRGNRQIQSINVHAADVRSVRFSPNAYYLLSAGYDQTLMLTDLQGDLSVNLNSVPVATHDDKIISARWHPSEFTFLSTSADKNATLWALPSP